MKKRVMVATICGLLSGLFCIVADIEAGLASKVATQLPYPAIGEILCNRTLVGFAIGISGLSLYHWSIHGMVMGFLFSMPLAFSCLLTPQYPEKLFVLTLVFGMIYGLFIELVASVIFQARQRPISKAT
ncbi:MAG: hypothetical protein ACOYXY_12225 [Thermodesulfobacteriota bacterium]